MKLAFALAFGAILPSIAAREARAQDAAPPPVACGRDGGPPPTRGDT